MDNIHVSLTGRTTLIEFGLAIYPSNEENRKQDIESLNQLFSDYFNDHYGDEGNTLNRKDKKDRIKYEENDQANDCKNRHDNEANSVRETIFDELVAESDDTTETTNLGFNLKERQEHKQTFK